MTHSTAAPVAGATVRTPTDQRQEDERRFAAERMSDLLRRYPDVEEEEKLLLLEFLKRGHPEELAKAIYGNGLQARAIAFKKDHPEHFPRGLRALWPWLALLILSLSMVLLSRMI